MTLTQRKENILKEKMQIYDLFISAFEDSADIHGKNLILELLKKNPNLKILAIAGPKMRETNIDVFMNMENFQVMGFVDIIYALPKLIKNFFSIRKKILKINPKASIFIDYPDFNLRLEKSLRKKGYKNSLIHYISPTIWAWRKKRADFMAKYLDLLITIFPFEKKYFSHTSLDVEYIGHPLISIVDNINKDKCKNNDIQKDLIGIFPGSRIKEIERNLPLQLKAAKKLLKDNKNFKFAISSTNDVLIKEIFENENLDRKNFQIFSRDQNYSFMKKMKLAMATSGTINLELALLKVPTAINFAIKPVDLFIARNLLKINLKHYCIVNIILNKRVFPELYGPNLSVNSLYESLSTLLDESSKRNIKASLDELKLILDTKKNPSAMAANLIFNYL
ncbi:MAG: Lipid-A-disaccharide synthase [Candidatus Anoxychlamydiales bacterium]|nr:Lipid-A-disaccharide synthase [Candidatus Anoxychlamydiales bacterium]